MALAPRWRGRNNSSQHIPSEVFFRHANQQPGAPRLCVSFVPPTEGRGNTSSVRAVLTAYCISPQRLFWPNRGIVRNSSGFSGISKAAALCFPRRPWVGRRRALPFLDVPGLHAFPRPGRAPQKRQAGFHRRLEHEATHRHALGHRRPAVTLNEVLENHRQRDPVQGITRDTRFVAHPQARRNACSCSTCAAKAASSA